MGCPRVRNLRMANQEDEMSIAGRWNGLALRIGAIVLALLVASGGLAGAAHAQAVGASLSGLITDARGGPVPGATVSIKNLGTGIAREVSSNGDGLYSAPNLLPGTYEVRVAAQGFQTSVQKDVRLTVGAQQALNVSLQVGQLNQTVEVSATPPDVQTASSTISATVDSTTVRELPLNGRDWTSLAALEPGVTSIPNQAGTGFSANKGNRGFGNQLSDAGHRANENSYRVNGISINDYSNGSPGGATGLNLGVDGIQEFSVLTSNYTAEYGHTSGAVINAITKSGVNDFHGTAFVFDRDKIFDAKNFFDPAGPIPSFRRVQFGGAGGTALVKDKTFVYGTYEGVRQTQPLSRTIHVPTQEARSGMLCVASVPPAPPNPCASLRTVTVDPKVVPYLALWPCPAGSICQTATNLDIASLNVSLPGVSKENYATGRVDQKISDRDSLSGSYFFDSGPLTQPDPLLNATHSVFSRRQMGSAEETHIFSPQLANTIRLGISRVRGDINLPVSGDSVATNTALAVAPGAKAPPQIGGAGLTTAIGLGGLNRFLHRWTSGQVNDDAFLSRGTHTIKFGFAFERMLYNVLEKLSPNGRLNDYANLTALLSNSPTKLNALAPGHSFEVAIRESCSPGTFKTIGGFARISLSTWACVMKSRHYPKMPTTGFRKSPPLRIVQPAQRRADRFPSTALSRTIQRPKTLNHESVFRGTHSRMEKRQCEGVLGSSTCCHFLTSLALIPQQRLRSKSSAKISRAHRPLPQKATVPPIPVLESRWATALTITSDLRRTGSGIGMYSKIRSVPTS